MDYSLANELKEAGFPQGGRGSWTVDPNRIVIRFEHRAYVPTLEELIKECANDFDGLRRLGRGAWQCTSLSELGAPVHNGKTPTEAVAHLWLAINKK
jgi:hypothetical protein